MFNKKQIISVLISIAVLVMMFVPINAETRTTITVENVTANMGETIAVPIKLSENTGICGATISVSYDERLVLTSIDKGSALSSLAMTKPGNLSANPVKIVWDGMDADGSNGIMALLTFALPNESGTFNVSVSYEDGDIVDGTLSPINILTQSGAITVGDVGGEGGDDTPEQNENVTIKVDSVTANSGGSIDVPIRLTNNTGICGATISVNYDDRLTLTNISKGEALSTLAMTKPGNLSANPAKIVWDGMDADLSNGIIAMLTFTVPSGDVKYDITLSYEDGDIVDGNLMTVKPVINNGYIQIGSSFETKVTVAGQTVTLVGQGENGKIIVAFYTENGKLLAVKTYDVTSNIIADDVNNAAKVKVMWWNGMNNMEPVCPAQTVNISQY